jgi:hypothetical protein
VRDRVLCFAGKRCAVSRVVAYRGLFAVLALASGCRQEARDSPDRHPEKSDPATVLRAAWDRILWSRSVKLTRSRSTARFWSP